MRRMKAPVSLLAIAAGVLLLMGVLWDAFENAVLSRRVSRGMRLTTHLLPLDLARLARRGVPHPLRAPARELPDRVRAAVAARS